MKMQATNGGNGLQGKQINASTENEAIDMWINVTAVW